MSCSRTLLLIAAAASLSAVEVAPLFGDNAVLQRGKPVPVWGKGKAGEVVKVRFAGQEKTDTVDKDGTWSVSLDKLDTAKAGRELVVAGDNTITLKNVVVGEVWICSGQSNMEKTVSTCANAQAEMAAADLPLIRQIKVPNANVAAPATTFKAGWAVASPKTVGGFTGAGFYFAREISKQLDVPVGLISSNWGGTRIEPWISPVGYSQVPELKKLFDQVQSWDSTTEVGAAAHLAFIAKLKDWAPAAEAAAKERKKVPAMPEAPVPPADRDGPTKLWNGMINPLVPYAIRGALWYQGEANGGEGDSYLHKLRALVGGWRVGFRQGDFPFYLVQLANFQKSDPTNAAGGDGWARIREAQRQALVAIPRCGMAVTIDIGDPDNVHPKNKQDVGKRLALWALAKDYGKKDLAYSGPLYREITVEEGKIRVAFDQVGDGLMVGEKKGLEPAVEDKDGKLTWWSIAGADKKWERAEAVIDGDSVVVSSPKVAKPVAVRYAYTMNPAGCNLYNKAGLPASPFRTDTW